MDNEITINGIVYVPKSTKVLDEKGLEYVIVRTYSAGVFAGYLESKEEKEVVLKQARRLWYWDGAASLSQLAQSGTTKPEKCKFPEEMSQVTLTEAIEIISVSLTAKESISKVAIWRL